MVADATGSPTITIADGTVYNGDIAVYDYVFGAIEATVFGLPENISKEGNELWPITIQYYFQPTASESLVNENASFINFQPCTGQLSDIETNYQDDAFDFFGQIQGLSAPEEYSPIVASSVVSKTTDTEAESTVYSFTHSDFYSQDSTGVVDVNVEITFQGNSITWQVDAYEPGTNNPAQLTFRIIGDLGSDSSTDFSVSNSYNFSSDAFEEDPVLIYNTNLSFEPTNGSDEVSFQAESGSDSGFLEVTAIGYQICATDDAITTAIDAFTVDYRTNFGTDISDVAGTCERTCSPSSSTLEVSDNSFDLAGVELCFDRGRTSQDPTVLLNQLLTSSDIGTNLPSAGYVDFEDVAIGSDVTLNAILTVIDTSNLEESLVVRADEFSSNPALNSRIRTDINYVDSPTVDQFVKYTLEFYVATDLSKTPVTVSNLNLNIYDIDNFQFAEVSNVSRYSISQDSILTITNSSGMLRASELADVASSSGDESRLTTLLAPANSFEIILGMSKDNVGDGNASYSLDFSVGEDWENPPTETPITDEDTSASGKKPVKAPTAPTAQQVTVKRGAGLLNVAIAYDGHRDSAPSSYDVKVSPGGNTCVAYGAVSSCDVLGLKVGVEYTVSIVAQNRIGTSSKYLHPVKYLLTENGLASLYAKKTIDRFAGDSPVLLKPLKVKIKRFVLKHPDLTTLTCTGYTAGPVKKSDKVLAKTRASNVCAYIEKIKPSVSTTTIGKTPGLPWGAANRKVVIRGYSAIG